MAGPIRIAVLANASQAKAELASVETRGQRLGRVMSKASKVAAVGLLALAVGAGASAKAAATDEAAQSKLAQTLRTAAHATKAQDAAVEKWITAQGKATGVTDDELRPAIGRLAAATGSVSKAQKLAALAMNVSTGTGKSLETVTAALAKAQTGSLGGLAKLGVRTKDASGKTLSLAKVTKDLAATYRGAAAKAATTTAGKQKILTTQMGELQEQIGAKLLPVMLKLANVALEAVNWISKHGTAAQVLVGVLAATAVVVIAVSKAIKVYNAIQALSALNAKRAAAGQKVLNLTLLANPVVLIVAGIVALAVGLVVLYKKSDKARAIMDKVWAVMKKVGEFIAGLLIGYIKLLAKLWLTMAIVAVTAWGAILKAALAAFSGILSAASKGLSWIPGIGGKIKTAKAAFEGFRDTTVSALDKVKDGLVTARDKVDQLGRAKAKPTIDTSSIDHANTRLDRLLDRLNKASGGLLGSGLPGAFNPSSRAVPAPDARVLTTSRSIVSAPRVDITVQVPPTANTAEIGRVTVAAIQEFYDAGGARL